MDEQNSIQAAKIKLLELNKKLKMIMPDFTDALKTDRVSISEIKEGYLDRKAIERVIIILRSSGCSWSLKSDGGCLMCGHYCGTTRGKQIDLDSYFKQIDTEFSFYDFKKYPMLCVYNSGSFLNDAELPKDVRLYLFNKVANTQGIKRLIIESRPEFITEEVLSEIDSIMPNVTVEIGVGLETSNNLIRDLCLNKGISSEEYITLATRMKNFKSKLLGYVLLKPPFLSEKFALQDAVDTIKFAFNNGFDIISLEPVSVQDYTIIDYLYEAGAYRPAWIWSVIEVIKQTYDKGLVRIGGFEFFPIPKVFTHNCEHCNYTFVKKIQDFNRSYDISVFDGLTCSCRDQWLFDMEEIDLPIDKKIIRTLGSINEEFILQGIRNKYDSRGNTIKQINKILYKSCSTPNL